MGITISSKRYSCDTGYGGFGRFRNIVAEQLNLEFYNHYSLLSEPEIRYLMGEERDEYFKNYDLKTREFINEGVVTPEVANFLYQSDCEGKIDRKQAREIFNLIKDTDDSIIFGYFGRTDCAKMADLKSIFSDKTKVEWY